MAAIPARNDRRIIIHLDYDCFYASVFEVEQPALKALPLAVQQKQIVVTCNYEARRRGLYKLQLIKDAKRICPDVVIVLGEDLTKFRDASKELYLFTRGFIWGGRAERLGFDEQFLDVTDMIDYNIGILNMNDLASSFFHLDPKDPTMGFSYDATKFFGSTYPLTTDESISSTRQANLQEMKLLVASHLTGYIRGQLEHVKGFTATAGVSTSKILAKLVGTVHKPNNQTTLLPPYETGADGTVSNVTRFLDDHEIRKIPGIGSRLAQKLRDRVSGKDTGEERLLVRDVRLFPGMSAAMLERILGGPGAPKGIGMRVWSILHGVDNTEVLEARDLPTQISIEDTYGRGHLDNVEKVRRELAVLTRSLIRRMRTDLLDKGEDNTSPPRWLAHPRTLRLSTRPRNPPETDGVRTYNANRISRSAPLPTFIFNLDENIDALAERVAQEHLLGMFRKIHADKTGWDLGLMNVAVTNMVESAGDQKQSSGRDIGKMFRQQEAVLREWSVPVEPASIDGGTQGGAADDHDQDAHSDPDVAWEEDEEEDEALFLVECGICGAAMPHFAESAHSMFHEAETTRDV